MTTPASLAEMFRERYVYDDDAAKRTRIDAAVARVIEAAENLEAVRCEFSSAESLTQALSELRGALE